MPLTPIKAIDVTQAPYNATGDGVTDDAAAIQAAVDAVLSDAVTATPGSIQINISSRLYFPPGKYAIGTTIRFSGDQTSLSIICDDAAIIPHATFTENPANTYAFYADWCFNFKVRAIHFKGFDKALFLRNPNQNSGQVAVEECIFLENKEALHMDCQSSENIVDKCKFYLNSKAIHFDSGDKISVRNCWIESGAMTAADENDTHHAQIENHGKLDIHECVFVPDVLPGAAESAWINNYNSVTVKDTRQGGESGGFTLINNFAPVSGDATAIIVKDSQCFSTNENIYDNPGTGRILYAQPAIVRYVTKVPNLTIIRNNRGLIDCSLVEFSRKIYGDSYTTSTNSTDIAAAAAASAAITSAIYASGTTTAAVSVENVVIEVANNVRGILVGGRTSFVPKELYPFVRDEESLWPDGRHSDALKEVAPRSIDSADNSITFTFNYGTDPNKTLLINYTGHSYPWPNYTGGFTGVLKANGFYTTVASDSLILETIFNQIGDSDPASWPTGQYTVEVYWQDTVPGAHIIDQSNSNRNFCIKITGRYGAADLDAM